MSDEIAELRARHALATERINDLDSNPSSSIEALGQPDNGESPTNPAVTARELWEAKLVHIHTAALRAGVELYPLADDGRCSTCELHIRTLQRMQPDGLAHQPC